MHEAGHNWHHTRSSPQSRHGSGQEKKRIAATETEELESCLIVFANPQSRAWKNANRIIGQRTIVAIALAGYGMSVLRNWIWGIYARGPI